MTYALLHDAPDTKITVTEIREITWFPSPSLGAIGSPIP
jgi:hypothetical protein